MLYKFTRSLESELISRRVQQIFVGIFKVGNEVSVGKLEIRNFTIILFMLIYHFLETFVVIPIIFTVILFSVQRLRVIFNKLPRTFDCHLSLYDIHASKKKLRIINLSEEKKIMFLRWGLT